MLKKIKNIYLKLMKKDLTKIEEKVEILTKRSEKMAKKARWHSMAFLSVIFVRDSRSVYVIYIATKARKNMCKSNSRPSRSTWAAINMWIKPKDNEAYVLFFVIYMVVTLFVVMCFFSFYHVFHLFFFLKLRGRQHGHPRIITEISRINQRISFVSLFIFGISDW